MAAQRYWRVVGIRSYGTTLVVSEVQLFSATIRVDAGVTLTANVGPTSGSIADLQDNVFTNAVSWTADQLKTLVLQWDFGGAPVDVQEVRWGALSEITNWIRSYALQYSNDGVTWAEQCVVLNQAWGSPYALSPTGPQCTWDYNLGRPGAAASRCGWRFNDSRVIADLVDDSGFTPPCQLWGTVPKSSGILSFEIVVGPSTPGFTWTVGIGSAPAAVNVPGTYATSWALRVGTSLAPSGNKVTNNTDTAFVTPASIPNVPWFLGVVVDFTAGSITFYKNGVSMGVAWTGLTFATPMYIGVGTSNNPGNSAAVGNTSFVIRTRVFDMQYPPPGASGWNEYAKAVESYAVGGDFPLPAIDDGYRPTLPVVDPGGKVTSTAAPIPSVMRGDLINFNPGGAHNSNPPVSAAYGYNTTFGTLSGYVTRDGAPSQDKIVVLRMNDWRVMWVGMSDPKTGFWKTTELDPDQKYVAFAVDHTGSYRAIVWDQMTLDPA